MILLLLALASPVEFLEIHQQIGHNVEAHSSAVDRAKTKWDSCVDRAEKTKISKDLEEIISLCRIEEREYHDSLIVYFNETADIDANFAADKEVGARKRHYAKRIRFENK